MKNNRYDSTFISYYENGQIEAKGSFKDCIYKTNALRITALGRVYCSTGVYSSKNQVIKVSDGNRNAAIPNVN